MNGTWPDMEEHETENPWRNEVTWEFNFLIRPKVNKDKAGSKLFKVGIMRS